jgi:hypothetical protein
MKMVSQKECGGFSGGDGKCRSLFGGGEGEARKASERVGKIAPGVARRQSRIQSDGKRKRRFPEEDVLDLLGTVGGNSDLLFPATRISKVGHNRLRGRGDNKSPPGSEEFFGGDSDRFSAFENFIVGHGARKSESEDQGGQGAELYRSPCIEVCSLRQGNGGGEVSLDSCLGFSQCLSNPMGPLREGGAIENSDTFKKWTGEVVKAGESLPAACRAESRGVNFHAPIRRDGKKNLPDIDG